MIAFACELGTLVSLKRKQTIIIGWPQIILWLGTGGNNRRNAGPIGLLCRHVGGHNRLALALVFRVYAEGAGDAPADALFLPDHKAGAGGKIITILLVDVRMLTACKVLDRVGYCGTSITAVLIAIDPQLDVDYGGFLRSTPIFVLRLSHTSLDG